MASPPCRLLRCSFLSVINIFLILLVSLNVCQSQQRRQGSLIDEWIRTIRQSPRAHSLSPSWNGKSPYDVIGVSNLPLQTEIKEGEQSSQAGVEPRKGEGGDVSPPPSFHHRDYKLQEQQRQQSFRRNPVTGAADYRRNPLSEVQSSSFPHKPSSDYPFKSRSHFTDGGSGRGIWPPNNADEIYPENDLEGDRRRRPSNKRPRPGSSKRPQPSDLNSFQGPSRRQYSADHQQGQHQRGFSRSTIFDRPTRLRTKQNRFRLTEPDPDYDIELHQVPYHGQREGEIFAEIPSDDTEIFVEEYPEFEYEELDEGPVVSNNPPIDSGSIRDLFSHIGQNPFRSEEHAEFPRQSFEQPPRPPRGNPAIPRFQRPKRHQKPLPSLLYKNGGLRQRPQEPVRDLDINAGIPPKFKSPSREKDFPFRDYSRPNDALSGSGRLKGPRFPSEENIEHGFKPFFKPSEQFEYETDEDEASYKLFDDEGSLNGGGRLIEVGERPFPPPPHHPKRLSPARHRRPIVGSSRPFKTTPRPIPTPGPEDFPTPPPRRPPPPPPPPPTHPTHPPLITHSPEHFRNFHPPLTEYFEEDKTDLYEGESPYDYNQRRSYEDRYSTHREEKGGFFERPESLEAMGTNFESMKIRQRSKRSAEPDVMRLSHARRARHQHQQHQQQRRRHLRLRNQRRRQQQQQQQLDEFGFDPGFWEDVDTDDFFSTSHEVFGQRNQPYVRNRELHHLQPLIPRARARPYNVDEAAVRSPRPLRRPPPHRVDPYPQQSVQSYPRGNDLGSRGFEEVDRDNEILGSGNFEVIKGGTFYDPETFYHSRYNGRPPPPPPSYDEDFFQNFRDFADIKGDLYRRSNYY